MTDEEAKCCIRTLLEIGGCDGFDYKQREALDMAIKVLEAQEQAIKEAYEKGYEYGVKEWFDKRTKAQTCIEDYPTCTECEHYDREKHYCPRFCQVIKDTLAEAEDEEVIRVSKGVLKARTGRFVVYDAEWLKEHFYETEEKIYGQPKKGKWIKIQSGDKDFPESIVCSRCKNENSHLDFDEHSVPIGKTFVTSKYCPNCGAKMEVEHE